MKSFLTSFTAFQKEGEQTPKRQGHHISLSFLFIISLNLISTYLIKSDPLEQINRYLSKFHGFPWEAPLASLIYLKILGIMITISIISYILSKIYIIFELPKTKELKYFSSKLIISLANEIRSIELLICFAIISIIFSFMVI